MYSVQQDKFLQLKTLVKTIQHDKYDNVLTAGHDLLQLPPTLHTPGQDEPPSFRGRPLVVSHDLLQTDPTSQGTRWVETLIEEMRINIAENESQ